MVNRSRVFKVFIGITVLLLLSLVASCADRDAPSQKIVQELLTSFYAAQGYKVLSLELGEIEGAPLAQKTYSWKRPYYVTVKSLSLEGNGRKLAPKGGVVTIRERKGSRGEWHIERVPPELAP